MKRFNFQSQKTENVKELLIMFAEIIISIIGVFMVIILGATIIKFF